MDQLDEEIRGVVGPFLAQLNKKYTETKKKHETLRKKDKKLIEQLQQDKEILKKQVAFQDSTITRLNHELSESRSLTAKKESELNTPMPHVSKYMNTPMTTMTPKSRTKRIKLESDDPWIGDFQKRVSQVAVSPENHDFDELESIDLAAGDVYLESSSNKENESPLNRLSQQYQLSQFSATQCSTDPRSSPIKKESGSQSLKRSLDDIKPVAEVDREEIEDSQEEYYPLADSSEFDYSALLNETKPTTELEPTNFNKNPITNSFWKLEDFKINQEQNGNYDYAFKQTLRGKAKKLCSHGKSCKACDDFYRVAGPIPDFTNNYNNTNLIKRTSKHKDYWDKPDSPPLFNEIEFPSTQENAQINLQVKGNKWDRTKDRLEWALQGGKFIFKEHSLNEIAKKGLYQVDWDNIDNYRGF